jgi:hypothetical protein
MNIKPISRGLSQSGQSGGKGHFAESGYIRTSNRSDPAFQSGNRAR